MVSIITIGAKTIEGAICGFIFSWLLFFILTLNLTGNNLNNAGLILPILVPVFTGLGALIGLIKGLGLGFKLFREK